MLMYGSDRTGELASPSNHLVDIKHLGEDCSLDENVESYISHIASDFENEEKQSLLYFVNLSELGVGSRGREEISLVHIVKTFMRLMNSTRSKVSKILLSEIHVNVLLYV
jgi:hypothetical protein